MRRRRRPRAPRRSSSNASRYRPAEEQRAVQHDVDLVGARRDDVADLLESDAQRARARREPARDARHVHRRCPRAARPRSARGAGYRHTAATDGTEGSSGFGTDRLRAHRDDLADRVAALEGRQVHAPDREVERPALRVLLDRAGRQRARHAPRARRRRPPACGRRAARPRRVGSWRASAPAP